MNEQNAMTEDHVKIIAGHGIRRERDFYPTPPECTVALVDFLEYSGAEIGRVWECAAGDGAIADVLEKRWYDVVQTGITTGTDFLTAPLPEGMNWIITNPPFNLAEAFIRRAASFDIPFAFLLKSQFWHSRKRYSLFNEHRPQYVLPLTWRPDFTGQGASLMDVLWCVWNMNKGQNSTIYCPLTKPN